MKEPPLKKLNWKEQFRIIPSHFPPINFFENIIDPSYMEEAFYVESLTNERLLEEVGVLSLIKAEDRISGKGASVVMAAFTHVGCPSRFTNGIFGIYYCSKDLTTAIHETSFHRANFLACTNQNPGNIDMRVYKGKVLKPMHDIRSGSYTNLHHPDNYIESQQFASTLRMKNSWGIVYNSVRHKGGECIAAFRPPAISIPTPIKHLTYVWDGSRIVEIYEKKQLFANVL